MLGVLATESESVGCCGGCWGDTKGLAGVTKGMIVASRAPAGAKHVVSALVSGAGTRTYRHRHRQPRLLLLDPVKSARTCVRGRGGSSRLSTLTARGTLTCGSHGRVEGRELVHHALVLLELVGMDGLCMLAEVVEAGKLLPAVTVERTFPGMFPV